MNQSRRQFLKVLAAAPIILPFGMAASPVLRFLKPTRKPLDLFDEADQPSCAESISFSTDDFPSPWVCIPVMVPVKIAAFNPERYEIREIPAFIIRADNGYAAYSRICPVRHPYRCLLNFVMEPNLSCGSAPTIERCCCAVNVNNPVLTCSCRMGFFDLAHDGKVLTGPAPIPPSKFELNRQGNMITIVRPEPGTIC